MSGFTRPVLSRGAPIPEAQPRRPGGGGGGPVIEYVRGPMRIAMAPVASANPNDAGAGANRGQRRGKKQRRWERLDRGGGRPFDRGPAGGGGGPRPPGQPGQAAQGDGANAQPGERRRRRRRRRRNNGQPMQNGQQMLPPADGTPVSFFEVRDGNRPQQQSGPPMLGPDGQPLRKRRRRRRRGRGGRQREWRQTGPGGEGGGGGPPPDAGGGPPSEG
jgi:hypothetical protein